jgi:hypothetical protein
MKYTIKVTQPEYWQEIHDLLCEKESSCSHIPDRAVACTDEKLHSPTRGTFELEEHEAEDLRLHEKIEWVELCPRCYPDAYPPPEQATKRFKKDVKIYRDLDVYGPPASATSAELDRTTWSVPRVGVATNGDFWAGVTGNPPVKNGDISFTLTGKNVDIVVHDSGVFQYHPEFLRPNGQSRVRDIVLDGPYYIDPDYFDINGYTYTKPDGRTGITTASAEAWWENGANRSAEFASIGTVTIPATYTAARAMGDRLDGGNSMTDSHGTACASLAAGKTYGLAFEAEIWNLPGIADNVGMDIEANYDLLKLFHKYKPINPETGVKNPTVTNGSWGYRAGFYSFSGDITYKFKGATGTFAANASTNDLVTAMKNGLYASGVQFFWSSSSRSSSIETAANEMMDTGVIYVAAAGNNNQRLGVGATDPHRLDYLEDAVFGTTDPRAEFPSGTVPSGHRDWLNPQGIGYDSVSDFHPVICVGAMDEFVESDLKERKANYSNNGPGIDVWAPADETIGATVTGINQNYQRYDDTRFYDRSFNGTSAAAPVVAGLIALYMESNPKATSRDVKNWLNSHGSKEVGTALYLDNVSDDTNFNYWTNQYNMRGARTKIAYNPYANDDQPTITGVEISGVSINI